MRKRRGRGRGGEHEEGVVGGFLHSWPVRRSSKIGAVEREGFKLRGHKRVRGHRMKGPGVVRIRTVLGAGAGDISMLW